MPLVPIRSGDRTIATFDPEVSNDNMRKLGPNGAMLFNINEQWVLLDWKPSNTKGVNFPDAKLLTVDQAIQWCDANQLSCPYDLLETLPQIEHVKFRTRNEEPNMAGSLNTQTSDVIAINDWPYWQRQLLLLRERLQKLVSTDIICRTVIYQNCKLFGVNRITLGGLQASTDENPPFVKGFVGQACKKWVEISPQLKRYICHLHKGHKPLQDVLATLDTLIERIPSAITQDLTGGPRIHRGWLDFLVSIGLSGTEAAFRLQPRYVNGHPYFFYSFGQSFDSNEAIRTLNEYGITTVEQAELADSGWFCEFEAIRASIDAIDFLIDPAFRVSANNVSAETPASLDVKAIAKTDDLQKDALRAVIDGNLGAVLNQASKLDAKEKYTAVMMQMFKQNSYYYEWSARDWADHLKASTKTIFQTYAWKHRMSWCEENRNNT